jgi:uncharacterized membrane protein/protein-disulfide isomerase
MKSANLHTGRTVNGSGLWMVASVLLLVAAAVAAYLGWVSFGGRAAIGCGPDSGCDQVLHSKWAYWFRVPVSLLAIPVYLAIARCSFRMRRSPECRRARLITASGALVLIAVAVWFTAVQLLIVKAFCPFCMTAHALGFVAAGLLLVSEKDKARVTRQAEKDRRKAAGSERGPAVGPPIGSEEPGRPGFWIQAGGLAVLLLALLIAGQAVQQRKTFAVSSIPAPEPIRATSELQHGITNTAVAASNVAVAPTNPPVRENPGRVLAIYAGQFQLAVDELPVIGQATAPQLIVSLFDYTCHHCRIMHERLLEVQKAFSNHLAIVSLPMPLDPVCNTLVKNRHPDHVNACEYARIGLAVWRARRSAMETYDHWVFAPERPPPVAEARRYAAELVGIMAMETALADPWVNAQIQRDIAIYDTAYRAGQGSMPQLIIGSKVAVGTLPIENVYQLLASELGLKAVGLPGPATESVLVNHVILSSNGVQRTKK